MFHKKQLKSLIILQLLLHACLYSYNQNTFELTGRIYDFDTKEPVKSASVLVRPSRASTITNDSGEFKILLPKGYHILVLTHVTYNNKTQSVNLSANSSITIEMKRKPDNELDEVIVNRLLRPNKVRETEMSIVRINPEQLRRIPVVLGDPDIIKALVLQPGITTVGEGAGGFNVRGGNADQNLVLLDGAPLFNTSHLLGFYSSVSPDMAQDLSLYKGSIPARYGGRLSSLLNIGVKPGRTEGFAFTGGISPVSARLYGEGPIIQNKLTFTAGARVAYPSLAMKLFPQLKNSTASFYDALVKLQYIINPEHKIAATFYRSSDKFGFDTSTAYNWKSNVFSVRYTGNLGDKFNLNVGGNFSEFHSEIEGLERNYESSLTSFIRHKEARADVRYKLSKTVEFEVGASGILYNILPSKEVPAAQGSQIIKREVESESGREIATYLNTDIVFTPNISLQAGVRFAQYSYLGPKNTFSYEAGQPKTRESITDTSFYADGSSITSYSGIEPRLSLRITLNTNTSIKVGYHRGQQFLHLVTNSTAISPVDFWKLSDQNIKQQVGSQYSAGFFKNFAKYDISLETYYRVSENQLEYKNGAILLLNPAIETALLPAKGYSYGAELSIGRNVGKTTGQINYTYSRSQIQVVTPFENEKINAGEYYNSNFDRPHNISIATRTKLSSGWTFNTSFVYLTGRPATYPDGNYSMNNSIVTNYSLRNQDRLPDYHRLDVSFSCVTRRFEGQKRYSIWNFSFYNVYSRANAYSIFFRRESSALKAYRLTVLGSIIPSISWNYHF